MEKENITKKEAIIQTGLMATGMLLISVGIGLASQDYPTNIVGCVLIGMGVVLIFLKYYFNIPEKIANRIRSKKT